VAAVLDRMVRLSYYDNVIQKTDKVTTRPQLSAHAGGARITQEWRAPVTWSRFENCRGPLAASQHLPFISAVACARG